MASWEEVEKAKERLCRLNWEYWLHENIFTFNWWFLLSMTAVCFTVWWVLVDKSRLTILILYGRFISGICFFMDLMGSQHMLWSYPTTVFPLVDPIVVTDAVMLPCIYTLVYQKFTSWGTFLVAMIIMSAVFSFCFEPFMRAMNIYEPHHWNHVYSFPIYIIIGLFVKWLVEKIRSKDQSVST